MKTTTLAKTIKYKDVEIHLDFTKDSITIDGVSHDFISIKEAQDYIDCWLADETWCQKTVRVFEAKKHRGEPLTDEEYESYYYALGVINSENAERKYLNGED